MDDRTGKLVNELLVYLKTGESLYVSCVFDTTFKKDSYNETVHGSLTICYSEHEHNDVINLKGEIFFPNIYLEKTNINFGCILNNTEVNQKIKMTNLSPLTVEYKWKFLVEKDSIVSNAIALTTNRSTNIDSRRSTEVEPLEAKEIEYDQSNDQVIKESQEDANQEEIKILSDQANSSNPENSDEKLPQETQADQDNILEKSIVKKSSHKLEELLTKQNEIDLPSIEEIFDISPLYGSLYPGETQNLTITYYGHKEIKAQVKAICEIKNGPDYEMYLKGEASVLNYELSEKSIDLGYVPFDEVCEAFISVRNLGKVTIEFGMVGPDVGDQTDANVEPDKPVIRPMKGFIEADKIETITIRYLPGIPKKFTKNLKLQISHFAPEDIIIKGEAGFADIMLDLPRFENDIYKALRRVKNFI
jgi:hydrocephalus-inducing protein